MATAFVHGNMNKTEVGDRKGGWCRWDMKKILVVKCACAWFNP
jgi:hypothetical protein